MQIESDFVRPEAVPTVLELDAEQTWFSPVQ